MTVLPKISALTSEQGIVGIVPVPAGTTSLHVARCSAVTAGTVEYDAGKARVPYTGGKLTTPITGTVSLPFVSVQAFNASGSAVSGWVEPRLKITPNPTPPPPPPPGLVPGLVTNGNNVVPGGITPPLVRMEFALGTSPATIATVARNLIARGCQLQPLIGGSIPSQAAAKSYYAQLGAALGGLVRHVEHLNETNYKVAASEGGNYARSALGAAEGLAGSGIGLLVQLSDAGQKSTTWIDSAFAAVPNLAQIAAGATIHPYWGGPNAQGTDSWGVPMMERMIAALDRHGATSLPVDATEWGVPSDNGVTFSTGQRATYAEAGQIIERHPALLQKAAQGRLRSLFLYQAYDQRNPRTDSDREHYFGVYQLNGASKGAMTTAALQFFKS